MVSHQPTHARSREGSRHALPPLPPDTGTIPVIVPDSEEDSEDNAPASSLLTGILAWTLLTALVLMGFFSAVGALNRDVYSASGFVRTYLNMIASHDITGALSLPGVAVGLPERDAEAAALLDRRSMGNLRDIEIVSDEDLGGGRHRVTAHYGLVAGERVIPGITEFTVQSAAPIVGVLNSWRFERPPTASLSAVVQNTPIYRVGEVAVRAREVGDPSGKWTGGNFTVLVPGAYTLSHTSYYVSAMPTTVAVTAVGGHSRGYVDAHANQAFVDTVQQSVNAALSECASQHRLYPQGCPFGKAIDDRIVGEPRWTITQSPTVRVIPGFGGWYVPQTTGVARLDVEVRSLFDGSISQRSFDVPFTVSPRLQLDERNQITLTW